MKVFMWRGDHEISRITGIYYQIGENCEKINVFLIFVSITALVFWFSNIIINIINGITVTTVKTITPVFSLLTKLPPYPKGINEKFKKSAKVWNNIVNHNLPEYKRMTPKRQPKPKAWKIWNNIESMLAPGVEKLRIWRSEKIIELSKIE